ncbi:MULTISPECIES: 4'-phosphopantetheinyl transferase family protein [unclassified Colwellia]|uniref:4'-phosphopantetheinyl transferase family protein n=1 Tax=unclassified Colwellia TaxID=196834 RepID=UPI0015F4FB9A|nr:MULTISPECIES: 4'-phosphopantetheinyl transferase superfamily protein [unclassified Colwellia]MBA6257655.1 4'-phosphopantetheinyl transferase superfamily protein [Colwellia sp. MB3u-28]MBA6259412.1 4'-phosphopantetheinyl transferase superfamily protein [Colwellia sp. MB3u-41]MBA6304385.1 4'-phosphopantetheinyl transferase superfamily protein [Colwellia sp. MB02u-14]
MQKLNIVNIYVPAVYNTQFLNEFNLFIPGAEHLTLTSYHYNVVNYNRSLFDQFKIYFPEEIKSSVIKRQAEYLAGRYAARCALHDLGFEVKNITTGKHRSPVWPTGISASITHTDSIAICAASYKYDCEYLGIDLEKRLNLKCITDIKSSIINLQEENLLFQTELSFEDAFTLTFSAKESLFKALYPRVGRYFDFSAAQIIDICCSTNKFTMILLEDLTQEVIAGKKFTGYFSFDETYVFTLISQSS